MKAKGKTREAVDPPRERVRRVGALLLAVAIGILAVVLLLLLKEQPDLISNPQALGTNAVLLGIPLLLGYSALHMVLWRNPRFSETQIVYQPASLNPAPRMRAIDISNIVEIHCTRLKGALGVVVFTKDSGRHEFRIGDVEGLTQEFLLGAAARTGFELILPDEPAKTGRGQ